MLKIFIFLLSLLASSSSLKHSIEDIPNKKYSDKYNNTSLPAQREKLAIWFGTNDKVLGRMVVTPHLPISIPKICLLEEHLSLFIKDGLGFYCINKAYTTALLSYYKPDELSRMLTFYKEELKQTLQLYKKELTSLGITTQDNLRKAFAIYIKDSLAVIDKRNSYELGKLIHISTLEKSPLSYDKNKLTLFFKEHKDKFLSSFRDENEVKVIQILFQEHEHCKEMSHEAFMLEPSMFAIIMMTYSTVFCIFIYSQRKKVARCCYKRRKNYLKNNLYSAQCPTLATNRTLK